MKESKHKSPFDFMEIAEEISKLSKENFKVGAIIIENSVIVGVGYNKLLNKKFNNLPKEIRKNLIIHAEMGAIFDCGRKVNNGILYCTLFPCNECAKHLIKIGVSKIYYKSDEKSHKEYTILAKEILKLANIEFLRCA